MKKQVGVVAPAGTPWRDFAKEIKKQLNKSPWRAGSCRSVFRPVKRKQGASHAAWHDWAPGRESYLAKGAWRCRFPPTSEQPQIPGPRSCQNPISPVSGRGVFNR